MRKKRQLDNKKGCFAYLLYVILKFYISLMLEIIPLKWSQLFVCYFEVLYQSTVVNNSSEMVTIVVRSVACTGWQELT